MIVVMHDTISTDETPQNENAASRSASHDIPIYTLYVVIFKKNGPVFFFTSILGAEPSKKVMPP